MPDARIIPGPGGEFRYVRDRFYSAGQDSFSDAPTQNEDLFESLVNVMPPVQGDFDRRYGTQAFNTSLFPGFTAGPVVPQSIYQDDVARVRRIVAAAGQYVRSTDEAGATWNSGIMVANRQPVRMVNSRSFGYFASGAVADLLKWNGATAGGTSKWGIASAANITVGPNNPGTAASSAGGAPTFSGPQGAGVGTSVNQSSRPDWTSPGLVTAADGIAAECEIPAGETSDPLQATGFGFQVPVNATVNGIVVEILRRRSFVGNIRDSVVMLLKAGVEQGSNKASGATWPTAYGYASYGGAADLWGGTWTASDINAANFGVSLTAQNNSTSDGVAFADFFRVTVYYTPATGGGTVAWTNPNNAKLLDAAYATVTVSSVLGDSLPLQLTNFGFALPASAKIAGITAALTGNVSSSTSQNNVSFTLMKAGSMVTGTTKSLSALALGLTAVDTTQSVGGAEDLWGSDWSGADINSSGFGIAIQISAGPSSVTLSVDVVKLTIVYEAGPILGSPISGTVTLVSGRQYTYVFENSVTRHYSDLAPFSPSTGALTSKNVPLSNLTISLDPQVDRKVILATGDGGDQQTLYFVADIPNSQTTYTDDTPEATLLLNNIYLNTDEFGNEVGVAANTPPPDGLQFPLKHRGRLYGAVGSKLYYSKSEAELFTPTGLLVGKYEEAWPALNYIDVSEGAEQITGLLSDGQVLYIGTEKRVLRLFGDGPSNFQKPETLFTHVGVVNQDIWRMVFLEGNPLGAMWLTPDYRVVGSDFNTYQDVGTPIQNVLDTINKTVVASVAWATYAATSVFNLFLLAVPTGSNTSPDTLLVFDMKGKRWYAWQSTDKFIGGWYNITTAGTPQIIVMADSGKLYTFQASASQDRVGDTPISFTVTAQTSWLPLGDPAARKYLNEIEVMTGDPNLLVSVDGASKTADFTAPHSVVASAALVSKPLGELFVPLAGRSTRDRYYRFKFVSSGTNTDVLRSINVEAQVLHRV